MELQLPLRTDGKPAEVLHDPKQITVIGANGSGKSRFCSALMAGCGDKGYRLSALRAMFPSPKSAEKPAPGSIHDMYDRCISTNSQMIGNIDNDFERLCTLMLIDEFRDLMDYKTRLLFGEKVDCPKTRLDTMVQVWQSVFPKNKVLRENGKLLFASEGHTSTYNMLRLSDGEKAALYYIGAVVYAMPDAVILIDDPETFIHHNIMHTLWNVIESIRPDCTFIYNTHDVDFASSRIDNQCIWVKSFDPETVTWDYEVMPTGQPLSDALYYEILGSRKPILFVEGDERHSLDSRLYPLIFTEYTIKPLGSCDKVIEAVRSFSDLKTFHRLDSRGIVDRDRRSEQEVEYLRNRNIFVPNVAEVENIFMLEGVIRAVARHKRRDEDSIMNKVKHNVFAMFSRELKAQALEHVRHRVKRNVSMRIDMKFSAIGDIEDHMIDLMNEINPRGMYDNLCQEFHNYLNNRDYMSVLRVFNYKQMLGDSNVAVLCGFHRKDDYLRGVLNILKSGGDEANAIRQAVKHNFGINDN